MLQPAGKENTTKSVGRPHQVPLSAVQSGVDSRLDELGIEPSILWLHAAERWSLLILLRKAQMLDFLRVQYGERQ